MNKMVKNAYKQQPLSEEQQAELQETVEEKADATRSFFNSLTSERFSSLAFLGYIPFIAFAALLAIFYIANRHYAERTARQIDQLGKEVKEMNWDYKALSADLMKLTTQSEI